MRTLFKINTMKNKSLIKKILVGLVIVVVVGFVIFVQIIRRISIPEGVVDPGYSSALDIELQGCKKKSSYKRCKEYML